MRDISQYRPQSHPIRTGDIGGIKRDNKADYPDFSGGRCIVLWQLVASAIETRKPQLRVASPQAASLFRANLNVYLSELRRLIFAARNRKKTQMVCEGFCGSHQLKFQIKKHCCPGKKKEWIKVVMPAEFLSYPQSCRGQASQEVNCGRRSLSIRCKVDVKSGISYGCSRVDPGMIQG